MRLLLELKNSGNRIFLDIGLCSGVNVYGFLQITDNKVYGLDY